MNDKQFMDEILETLSRNELKTVDQLRSEMADRWNKDDHWPTHADAIGKAVGKLFGKSLGDDARFWSGKIPSKSSFKIILEVLKYFDLVVEHESKWRLTEIGVYKQKKAKKERDAEYDALEAH